jgi:myo-inositol-1(or 4)-monophosphatase
MSRDWEKVRKKGPSETAVDDPGQTNCGRSDFGERMSVALEAAKLGSRVLQKMGRPRSIRAKSPRDLVTEVDLETQRVIESCLRAHFPHDRVLGEEQSEGHSKLPEAEYVWAIDPLDGTTNFVHGVPIYCVSVGLLYRGQPVLGVILDPCREECFAAEAGRGATLNDQGIHCSNVDRVGNALVSCSFAAEIDAQSVEVRQFVRVLPQAQAVRRTGSTALNLAYVAAGRFDAFWSATSHAWDVVAGMILVREAGGSASSICGESPSPLLDARVLASANPLLHHQMLKLLDGSA